jgi:uncharacterized protein
MLNIIYLIIGIYVALVGGMYVFQRNLLYFPSTDVPNRAQAGVPDMRVVTLKTEDGISLRSWYKQAQAGQKTIVIFHGNGGHIGHRGYKARSFIDAGFGVLLVEYRGYGGNLGTPSEQGFRADAWAALSFLIDEKIDFGNVVLYGESLGTGVAVHLATDERTHSLIKSIVLEAPYTSIPDVAAHHYPFLMARYIVKDSFDSYSNIGRFSGNLLVIHGEIDRTVPISFGRQLFSAAQEPKKAYWLPNLGHNDVFQPDTARLVIDHLRPRIPKDLP